MKIITQKSSKKIAAIAVTMAALIVISSMAFMPTNAAADPTVNSDTWFVLVFQTTIGKNVTYPSAGVTHIEANNTWTIMRSPQVAGTVQIGVTISQMACDFNNITNTGTAVFKYSMNFSETNSTKNPYGVGTMNVVATVAITSLGTPTLGLPGFPANGTGTLASTSGTGAFTYAKLYGDLVMNPLFVGPLSPNGYTEALFFGTHPRVNGIGVIVYYPPLSASASTSVTVLKGQTWYFFVQVLYGLAPYSLQWYEGSTPIAGQTDMVLSINKAVSGTYTYTCRVTDSYGNVVTTNAVTLTVL